jgi:HlyD family secretion protein
MSETTNTAMVEPRASVAPPVNGTLADRVQQLRLDNQLERGNGGGRSRAAWLPWVLVVLMAIAWAGVGLRAYRNGGGFSPNGAAPPTASGSMRGANSGTSTATTASGGGTSPAGRTPSPSAPGELLLQIKGNVIPFLQINLSPDDVSGVVEEIFFKEGDRVKQGQLLARIRNNRYLHDYLAAQAAVAAAKARLADLMGEAVRPEERRQAEAELEEARAAWIRADQEVKRLSAQRSTGTVSAQEMERADADLKAAAARVARLEASLALLNMGARRERIAAAQAELHQAEARLRETERLLRNCDVRAPIDGTILTKVADRGALVSPMSFNVAAGICSMADLAKLEVEIDVPERQITKIRYGLDCLIQADADPNRGYRGMVDRIMPIADDTKNVIKVRIRTYLPVGEEPGSFLKPKMSVVATVYNRPFAFNPTTDQPWGDEKSRPAPD